RQLLSQMTHHNADQGDGPPTDESPSGSAAERLPRAREALADAEAAGTTAQIVARDADVPESARADAEPDPHDVARQIVLRQLTMAPRTRQQLADKLRQKGCDDDVAAVVLDRMVEVGL